MQIYKRLPYVFVAACAVLYFFPFIRVLSQNGDEGTLIMGAVRVSEGQVPFRDFFEVMGPGTFYWLALFFKLLGTTWFATRVCLLVTTTAITVLLYYLVRRLRCGRDAAPVIFFVAVSFHRWKLISHHMDSNLCGMLAFAALVFGIDRRQPFALFLAGFAAGLTTWFMLPKGLLVCISFLAALWVLCRKESSFWRFVAVLMAGYILVMITVLALYWRAGGLTDLVYANLLWPLRNYSEVNNVPYGLGFGELYRETFTKSFSTVCWPSVATAISGLLSLPFAVLLAMPLVLLGFGLFRRRLAFDRTTVPYWLSGAALWISELHRKDLVHVAYGSPLLIILAFYLCNRLDRKWINGGLQLITASAVLLAMLHPLVALAAPNRMLTRRGIVYSAEKNDPVLEFLNAHISLGEPIFAYPYIPFYYFLSGARNPTRYSILMYQMNTEAQFREVVRCLEINKTRYVVWDRSFPSWGFPSFRMPAQEKLIVEPYLQEHYRVVGTSKNQFQILKRKL
jgi:hypothetical protein